MEFKVNFFKGDMLQDHNFCAALIEWEVNGQKFSEVVEGYDYRIIDHVANAIREVKIALSYTEKEEKGDKFFQQL